MENNEGFIKDAYEIVAKEIQTLVTILYFLMIGIGMLFKYKIYSKFGINIFEYADVFDFLIAPFQDIFIVFAALFAILFAILFLYFDFFAQKRFPTFYTIMNGGLNKKAWYNRFRIFMFVGLLIYTVNISSSGYARHVEHSIIEKEDISIKYANNEVIKGKMIGKTKDILFLLKGEKVIVIPITSLVKEIVLYDK